MSPLAEQQNALLAALWQPRADSALQALAPHLDASPLALRGLQAYRSNAHALAERALSAAFPVLLQLLDESNFRGLSLSFWQRHPPVRGDVAQWGETLAAHIETLPDLLAEEPYLPDVARAEWALHAAATAGDAQADPASFALLAQGDPARVSLVPCPGVACIESRYPVASIITAHLQASPTLAEAGQRLRDGVAETALVWRQGLKPCLREAAPGEAAFIAALKENASLIDSLAAAPQLDFNQWLLPAVQSGLVIRAAER